MEVIYQGKLGIKGLKIECTDLSLVITTIIITNTSSNFTFTLKRFEKETGVPIVPLYSFELNQGDTIRDGETYPLSKGDYLEFTSDNVETTYYIRALKT